MSAANPRGRARSRVDADEELRRVVPVIEALAARDRGADLHRHQQARGHARGRRRGRGLINDVRALRAPGALEAAARTRRAVCLMHMQGEPRTMQQRPALRRCRGGGRGIPARARRRPARAAGIARGPHRASIRASASARRWSTISRCCAACRRWSRLGLPVLVGLSRKSMLGSAARAGRSTSALAGSLALAALAVLNGARIVRAHDVAATVDARRRCAHGAATTCEE